jgi:1-acyl-sn-glycerol-3-phosphate acyltransferase
VSDLFYKAVRWTGLSVWTLAARPVILHRERFPSSGRALLAPNHLSPYDVPALIAAFSRPIDFVSIEELFRIGWVRWFFTRMNVTPLDRSRKDITTVRRIIQRLEKERMVGMFPEGGLRRPEESMLTTGRFQEGIIEIARLGDAPIIPCVLLGTGVFARPAGWLPGRGRYGMAFGKPIRVAKDAERSERELACEALRQAYAELYKELCAASGLDIWSHPWYTRRDETV